MHNLYRWETKNMKTTMWHPITSMHNHVRVGNNVVSCLKPKFSIRPLIQRLQRKKRHRSQSNHWLLCKMNSYKFPILTVKYIVSSLIWFSFGRHPQPMFQMKPWYHWIVRYYELEMDSHILHHLHLFIST